VIDCTLAVRKGEMHPNFSASGVSVIVPYTNGNGSAHAGQTVTSSVVTGYTATLPSGTFNTGNGTLTYTISGIASTSGTATFALNIGGSTCNLDLSVQSCSAKIDATTSKIFNCYNLGAYNTRASANTPSWQITGGYWQWGRLSQAAPGPVGPGANEANENAITGWSTTAPGDNAWADGVKTADDPCPQGFRVPTKAQWEGVVINGNNSVTNVGTWTDGISNYDSGKLIGANLFLPAAGYRLFTSGILRGRNRDGDYWSSTFVSGTGGSWNLNTTSSSAAFYDYNRNGGSSIRCISVN